MLTWKIVGASKALVLYIYIDDWAKLFMYMVSEREREREIKFRYQQLDRSIDRN